MNRLKLYTGIILIGMALIAAALLRLRPAKVPVDEGLDIVLTEAAARDFFGSQKVRLLVQSTNGIHLVDFSRRPWTVVEVEKGAQANPDLGVPLISPDGTRYVSQAGGRMYVARLEAGAPGKSILPGRGLHPRWWVHPKTGDEYIIYVNRLPDDPSTKENARTLIQQIAKGGCGPVGEARVLIDGEAFHGGRSPDGRYMVKGFGKTMLAELKPDAIENALVAMTNSIPGANSKARQCSISQDPERPDLFLFDGRGEIRYCSFEDSTRPQLARPAGFQEFGIPEWSTHPDVAVARLTGHEGSGLFAYRFSLARWLPLAQVRPDSPFAGAFAHLWVEKGPLPPREWKPGRWDRVMFDRLRARAPTRWGVEFRMDSLGGLPIRQVDDIDNTGRLVLRTTYATFPTHFDNLSLQDRISLGTAIIRADDEEGQAAIAYLQLLEARQAAAMADAKAEEYLKASGSRAEQARRDAAACDVPYAGPRRLASEPDSFETVIQPPALQRLFGGAAARLIYLSPAAGGSNDLRLIDFAVKGCPVRTLFSVKAMHTFEGPFISPDGTRVVLNDGDAVVAAFLGEGGPGRTVLAPAGYIPRWWIHPATREEYVIYVDRMDPQPHDDAIEGVTFIQKLKKGTCEADGAATVLIDKYAFHGGRSLDGRYICTALPGFALAELKPLAVEDAFVRIIHSAGRMCNPSISQDPGRMDAWLWEDRGHSQLRCYVSPEQTGEIVPLPNDGNQVQSCEWSTHPDFITALIHTVAGDGVQTCRNRIYVYQWSTDTWTLLALQRPGGLVHPHLWIDGSAKPVHSEPTAGEKVIESWDVRLMAEVGSRTAGRGGKPVPFTMESRLPSDVQLLGIDDQGRLNVRLGRIPWGYRGTKRRQADRAFRWTALSLTDRRNLAEALAREGGEESQALAAFYTRVGKCRMLGEAEAQAGANLAAAGRHAADVRADLAQSTGLEAGAPIPLLARYSRSTGPAALPAPAGPARPESTGKDAGPAWPTSSSGLLFAWETGRKPPVLQDATGQSLFETHYSLVGKGLAYYDTDYAMQVQGGAFLARKVGPSLVASIRKTSQFTFQIQLRPDGEAPASPAVVAWLGSTNGTANLALLQAGQRLSFRIRTAGGRERELDVGEIHAGRTRQVTVTFKPGECMAYLDGRESSRTADMPGDLSEWCDAELLFGNSASMREAWRGGLEGVAIFNRAFDAAEAARDAAAAERRVAKRKPAPRVVVKARLSERSGIGDARSSTYPMAYAIHQWDVEDVLEGSCDSPTIRVAHWVWLENKVVKMAAPAPGNSERLVLEPIDSADQVKGPASRFDTLETNLDMPLYYDLRPPEYPKEARGSGRLEK